MDGSIDVHKAAIGLFGDWGRCAGIIFGSDRSSNEKAEASEELKTVLGTLILLGHGQDIPRDLLVKLGMIEDDTR